LPFAFGAIAWTSYAERYIYLASAYWTIAICLWFACFFKSNLKLQPIAAVFAIIVIILAGSNTYARNVVWQTNIALLHDSITQNPNNKMLRDIYTSALMNAGRINEAKEQYRIASTLRSPIYDDRADVLMGWQLVKEKQYDKALMLYENALNRSKFNSEPLLVSIVKLLPIMMEEQLTLSDEEHTRLKTLLNKYLQILGRISTNPDRLIEAGKVAMQHGSSIEADSLLTSAIHNMSDNHRLRPMVIRLREQVKQNESE